MLGRLHEQGIAYGNEIDCESFLVDKNGKVLMQGFAGAIGEQDKAAFEKQLDRLTAILAED